MNKSPKYINFKKFYSKNGFLFFLEKNNLNINNLPIKVNRIFFTKAKKNSIRGEHAHIYSSQIIICIKGKISIITVSKKNKKKKFTISEKRNRALLVPNLIWNTLKFKEDNSIIAVLCDHKYNRKKDYIEDFKKFLNND